MTQRPTIRVVETPAIELGTLYSQDDATSPPTLTALSHGDATSLPLIFAAKRLNSGKEDAIAALQYVLTNSVTGDTVSCAKAVEVHIRHVRMPPEARDLELSVATLLDAYPFVQIVLPPAGGNSLSISSLPRTGVLRASPDARAPALAPRDSLFFSRAVYYFPDILEPNGEVLSQFTYAVHDDVGASAPATVTLKLESREAAAIVPVGGAGYAARLNGTSHVSLGNWSDYASIHAEVRTASLW